VKSSGSVECWGDDTDGQSTPPSGIFKGVSAGYSHTCGVKSSGRVECWGDDTDGRATPPSGSFESVSAGDYHTCGVKSSGSVECWGLDDGSNYDYGQVSDTPTGP
jgi:alpha-tubulin suppressor-like RCC1 family protein